MVLEGPGLGEGGGLEPHGASWLEIGAHGDPAGKLRKGLFLGELEPSSSVGPPGMSPRVTLSAIRTPGVGQDPSHNPLSASNPCSLRPFPMGGHPEVGRGQP